MLFQATLTSLNVTLEQDGFESHMSAYKWIFFDCKHYYTAQFEVA